MTTTRSTQIINGIELHNKRPDEMTFQVHTNRFIVSFSIDTKRVFYEIKDPSIQGEPFNVILILICYELSIHQLCRNIDFVSSFFSKIILHLRSQIPKLLKYHKHIELIRKFFNEPSLIQYMVIPVSSFELEVHRNRTQFVNKTSKTILSSIRIKFEEYGNFLGESCSQIMIALSTQPQQIHENVWKQRQTGKETQTQTPKSSISIKTQTDDSFSEIMTENAELKKEIVKLQELLNDNSDLKRKIFQLEKRLTKSESKPEDIPFTLKDHERFMNEHIEIFEKEKAKLQGQITLLKEINRKVIENGRSELKELKNSSMEYFRKEMITILSEYPITQSELGNILRISNPDDIVGPLCSWSMNTIMNKHRDMIRDGTFLAPPRFCNFWNECVLPRITESSPPILQKLKKEWEQFRKMCKSSDNEETFCSQINVVFSQYIQDYSSEKYDGFVIPFFNILIHSCKNIIILVGLINLYFTQKEDSNISNTIYEEFECIMILPNPVVILKEIIELSKQKLLEMKSGEEDHFPMPPIFNKLVYGVQLPSPSFFETLVESL